MSAEKPKSTRWLLAGALALGMGAPMACTRLAPETALDDYLGAAWARTASAPASRPPAASQPASAPADDGPLAVSVQEAILLALENNRALAVVRLNPAVLRTYERQERAVFDPVLSAEVSAERVRSKSPARTGGMTGSRATALAGSAGIEAYLPAGTTVALEVATEALDSSLYSDTFAATRVGLSVTQALLRGAGARVNLATLRQARLDTLSSQYELRGFAEALLAEVESAYWDCALAQRQIDIYSQSQGLARKQLAETQERVRVGKLAQTELAAAKAEVALRTEGLINARSSLQTQNLRLLRLLNPPGGRLWQRRVVLRTVPAAPDVGLDDVAKHVRIALRMRPELNQTRLAVRRGDLEIVKTKNGLLPKLDLFVALGKSGYAASFGRSAGEMDDSGYDALVGLSFEHPPFNRDARAQHKRAVLSREQALEAVANLTQLVEVDVRSAFIEVQRSRQQIAATAATQDLQAEKLRAETEKFGVGRSTSLLVAQAQRDLLDSQISRIEAVANYLKALVDLHRLEGSLLERRGIAAPGREPVDLKRGH